MRRVAKAQNKKTYASLREIKSSLKLVNNMNNRFDLSSKTAIVTGGSTGLGAGMAVGLAEAGADIVLVDRTGYSETAEQVRAVGRKVINIVADLSTIAPIEMIMRQTLEEFGKVDILVNNAGIIRRTPAIDFSEKDWDEVMAINTKTVFFFCQAVAKDMMKRKYGKIINISSLLAF